VKTCYIDRETRSIADLIPPGDILVAPGDPFQGWTISRINVPKEHRGKGLGSAMLKRILADADEEGIDLYLVVYATGALDDEQLTEWYERYGFVSTGAGGMVRTSQKAHARCKVF
jgi:ribosomal protein S18 acetylase RimI-like enzyme